MVKAVRIEVIYEPLMPDRDVNRSRPFDRAAYVIQRDETFEEAVDELIGLSVRLLELLPDPSLGPDERLERLARVVPTSQLQSANRRTARAKLEGLRRRLSELVPDPTLNSTQRLEALISMIDEIVPGEQRLIEKLETIGDYRSTDTGVSPWNWQ